MTIIHKCTCSIPLNVIVTNVNLCPDKNIICINLLITVEECSYIRKKNVHMFRKKKKNLPLIYIFEIETLNELYEVQAHALKTTRSNGDILYVCGIIFKTAYMIYIHKLDIIFLMYSKIQPSSRRRPTAEVLLHLSHLPRVPTNNRQLLQVLVSSLYLQYNYTCPNLIPNRFFLHTTNWIPKPNLPESFSQDSAPI